jgi:hypothetical protein
MDKLKFGFIFIIHIAINLACGVQFAPGEIQFFSGDEPIVTFTPTPPPTETAVPTPSPMPTATPIPANTVIPAAIEAPPPPPAINGANDVTIISYVDDQNVQVLVDGVEYTLPYATLPPPPPQPQPVPLPAEWDPRLNELDVWVSRPQATAGQPVYRLTSAYFEDEAESGGLHHIFVEVLDEKGQRILGQPVTQAWADGQATGYTENKPHPEYSVNFPMYGAQGPDNYAIYLPGVNSDTVYGLGLPAGRLTSYRLTFQRQYK